MEQEKKTKKTFAELLWGSPADYVPPAVDNQRIERIMKSGFLFGFTASDLFIFLTALLTLVFLQLEPYLIPYLEGKLGFGETPQAIEQPAPPTLLPAPPKSRPPPQPEGTPASQEQDIQVMWSYIGRHDIGDRYYLHAIVTNQNPSWIPDTITILDPATGETVGPFLLNDRPDTNICPALAESGHVYWTEGIEPAKLTQALRDAITLSHDPQTFHLTLRDPQGRREILELDEETVYCESSSE